MTSALSILVHALVLVVFVNRYIAGLFLRLLKGRRFDETVEDFEPTVTVVIPMFNEGIAIQETLRSLLAQQYPAHKLSIAVVDDCSSDDSFSLAQVVAREAPGRLHVMRNRVNMGKRRSINRAVRETSAEIIVSVDSDVVVEPNAIRELVRRFVLPEIAAVGGRVDVRNKHVNWLTRMQTIKYHFAYSFMKNLEWSFRRVMCLSGCLTAYRRSVLIELEPILEKRAVLGVPIKYGEDRFLTRQIVKAGYLTTMTLDAVCRTTVPTTMSNYFSQQLRWRRSNLIDYVGGVSHVWRLNPIIAIHFFSLFGLLLAYPALVIASLTGGTFFPLMTVHIGMSVAFGMLYRFQTRRLPASERVSPLAFIPIAFIMPVTYAMMTPLALFTLDSGSWETRNHVDVEDPATGAVPISSAAKIAEPEPTVSRAELPAA